MAAILLSEGTGRTRIDLSTQRIGSDLVVFLFNEYAHVGAVAMADFNHQENRASTSVMTRFGHKDDLLAYNAAYRLCKQLRIPVCAIAGIHLDNITEEEISEIKHNCEVLIERLVQQIV
jgi:gallate decarboxylase subunit D